MGWIYNPSINILHNPIVKASQLKRGKYYICNNRWQTGMPEGSEVLIILDKVSKSFNGNQVLKDISTVRHEPGRLGRWARIAMETVGA